MSEVVEVTFEEETTLVMEFSENGGGGGGTTDHALLSNRDKEDQHPIEAISGLRSELDNKLEASDVAETIAQELTAAKESGEFDGLPGRDGTDGTDGISPTVSVVDITGGHRVTVTDANGTNVFDVMDGSDGTDGTNGVSPTVSVTDITGGKRITIVAANGITAFDLMDGVDGQDGQDGSPGTAGANGVSPTVSVATIAGGHRITITDVNGTNTFDVMDGEDGTGGGAGGANGVTFYPSVDASGNLSWTNDGGLTNPDTVNITGPAGTPGVSGSDGADGADGVSPTVSVEAITGGHRITITDANDTKTVDVMDGSDGAAGSPGADGDDGVGVASVEQTATSTSDGGENIITVTLTNGTKQTFTVKNGSKGSDGAAGKDGPAGAAATINGVNALTLAAEEPLALEQSGNTATLKLTGDVGVTANEASATLTTSGWTTHSVLGYQQTVTVTGITAAAKAISTDVELSTTDKDSNTAILAAYALIAANPATPGANALTFYAESIPEVNVPVVVGWL